MSNVLQEKDNYGNEVTQLARPLPVEYLLVDMSAAFPVEPLYTFKVADKPFPKENRHDLGVIQVTSLKSFFLLSKNVIGFGFLHNRDNLGFQTVCHVINMSVINWSVKSHWQRRPFIDYEVYVMNTIVVLYIKKFEGTIQALL